MAVTANELPKQALGNATPTAPASGRFVRAITKAPVNIVLIAIALLWLVPSFGLLVASLLPASISSTTGWWHALAAPSELTIQTYRTLLQDPAIVRAFGNTALITVPASLLVVIVSALAAYAFAWGRFKGRDIIFLVVVGLLVVPLQVALIPVAKLYASLHIFGSIPGVVLFHLAFGLPFAIFLLRNFFIGIPHELLEAARMDGAGEFKIFWRVVLPLGLPAIASLLIFQFMWVWNDLLVALVFASPKSAPMTVYIQSQLRTLANNIDIIAPGAFLQLIVPLVVFFAFQRYFVQGLLAGSVK